VATSLIAPTADWTGEDVSLGEIIRQLGSLRLQSVSDGVPELRTNVMTHMAWIPPRWAEAAEQALAGLAERHPSRTLLLIPCPEEPDGLDAAVSLRRFALEGQERRVSTEVIELRLRGTRAAAPASIVWPLLIPDLPVFLRWRGEPPWGASELDQLVDVTDRLVVDSREWGELRYGKLGGLLTRVAVSDIAWTRITPWRWALARRWPDIAEIRRLSVRGPKADAGLLVRWLRSRLDREVALEREDAAELEAVAVDGDQFGHDIVYESAVLVVS
jgi:glucose-6-phosphate dehydrogenase assembly protein OpcA